MYQFIQSIKTSGSLVGYIQITNTILIALVYKIKFKSSMNWFNQRNVQCEIFKRWRSFQFENTRKVHDFTLYMICTCLPYAESNNTVCKWNFVDHNKMATTNRPLKWVWCHLFLRISVILAWVFVWKFYINHRALHHFDSLFCHSTLNKYFKMITKLCSSIIEKYVFNRIDVFRIIYINAKLAQIHSLL